MSNHLACSLPQPPSQLLLSPAQHCFKQISILRVSPRSRVSVKSRCFDNVFNPSPTLSCDSILHHLFLPPFTCLSQAIAGFRSSPIFTFLSPLRSRSHVEPVKVLRLFRSQQVTFFFSDLNERSRHMLEKVFQSLWQLRCLFPFHNLLRVSTHCFRASLEGLTFENAQWGKVSDADSRRIVSHPLSVGLSLKQWRSLLARIWCQCRAQREESRDK